MRTGTLGKLLSIDARGRFGYSGGFGRIAFGDTRLGFYNWYCGIYQKKYYYGKPFISRMKFYRPTNPQTETQQAWRALIQQGWDFYRALSDDQKLNYKVRSKNLHMTGPNLFMSEFLKARA